MFKFHFLHPTQKVPVLVHIHNIELLNLVEKLDQFGYQVVVGREFLIVPHFESVWQLYFRLLSPSFLFSIFAFSIFSSWMMPTNWLEICPHLQIRKIGAVCVFELLVVLVRRRTLLDFTMRTLMGRVLSIWAVVPKLLHCRFHLTQPCDDFVWAVV